MAEEYYTLPEAPVYNAEEIRKIQDSDPVRASTIVNPVVERLIENTHAVKLQADDNTAAIARTLGVAEDADDKAERALRAAQQAAQDAAGARLSADQAMVAADAALEAITKLANTIDAIPSQNGSLTYTGSAQTPSWNSFNPDALEIGGDTSGTNAGTYTATFTPKENYTWGDGTNDARSVTWTIGRAAIATAPVQSGSLTYTGQEQTPSWSNYNSAQLTIGGTASATNAGTYSASFTPTANYQWADGKTAAKSVNWTIAKAAGSLSLNKTSMTLNGSTKSSTIAVTRVGDGAVSATSSNTSVATVSVSGTTVTVTGKAYGTVTITVRVAAGTNHTAPADKTCSVTVNVFNTNISSNSWAAIKAASDAGEGANFWSVGDTKPIVINGKVGNFTFSNLTINPFILGFNHNSAKEGSKRIHWLIGKISGKMVGLCDDRYNSNSTNSGYFQMNTSNTNVGGWKDSYMRKTLLGNSNTPTSPLANSLMAALPSDLRAVMKAVTKYTDNVGNATGHTAGNVTSTSDYLFLLSNYEVQGNDGYANSYEKNSQAQYDYFKAGNSKVAYRHSATGTAVWWWLRSPYYDHDYNFCIVNTDGAYNSSSADYSAGLLPGFAV